MSTLDFLKGKAKKDMTLEELVSTFEEAAEQQESDAGELSMTAGAYSVMGEASYSLTLMRQITARQTVCMELLFPVNADNKSIRNRISDKDVEGDFFRCVRSSRAYQVLELTRPDKVEIYIDED